MNKVNWGIIGVGDVTEVKSGPAFNRVENSEIITVMRRNLDKVRDYANRHGIPNYTNNADDVLNNPKVNAIYIATPPSTHAEYTIKAANSGKHVYVEKPMGINHKQCVDMINASRKNNVKLFVAYYRRELEYFKKIKQLVDNGIIGNVKLVDVKFLANPKPDDYNLDNLPWRVRPEIAGAGYFFDLASHQLDFLDFLFGPIQSVSGHATNQLKLYNAEDVVSASFLFESNIVGTGTWCFSIENSDELDSTEIIGSKGSIKFSFFSTRPIEIQSENMEQKLEIPYPKHVQQGLISTVVNDILGNGQCLSTGDSAARTNWVMQKILK